MHSVTDRQTDRQTDGQQDDANSRSYCVAVRSAKNCIKLIGLMGLILRNVTEFYLLIVSKTLKFTFLIGIINR